MLPVPTSKKGQRCGELALFVSAPGHTAVRPYEITPAPLRNYAVLPVAKDSALADVGPLARMRCCCHPLKRSKPRHSAPSATHSMAHARSIQARKSSERRPA